jgi:hypothetical protein
MEYQAATAAVRVQSPWFTPYSVDAASSVMREKDQQDNDRDGDTQQPQ